MKIKVMNVVGARPNFMKIAPIISEMNKHPEFELKLLHTGQHYDAEMSKLFENIKKCKNECKAASDDFGVNYAPKA